MRLLDVIRTASVHNVWRVVEIYYAVSDVGDSCNWRSICIGCSSSGGGCSRHGFARKYQPTKGGEDANNCETGVTKEKSSSRAGVHSTFLSQRHDVRVCCACFYALLYYWTAARQSAKRECVTTCIILLSVRKREGQLLVTKMAFRYGKISTIFFVSK